MAVNYRRKQKAGGDSKVKFHKSYPAPSPAPLHKAEPTENTCKEEGLSKGTNWKGVWMNLMAFTFKISFPVSKAFGAVIFSSSTVKKNASKL